MAVKVGSARSDERGKITGGKAGDQKSGKEVGTQTWYKHTKGWRVFRCIIPEARPLIAKFMKEACANDNIGYDQYQRTGSGSLRSLLAKFSYSIKSVSSKCETDCSALVNDCITCALRELGRNDKIPNFTTSTEAKVLLNTGLFVELTGSKYTDKPDFLAAGDVLVTRKKGHTVIVLNDGDKVEGSTPVVVVTYALGDRTMRRGMSGADVKELQNMLKELGYEEELGEVDGKFGEKTEVAVKAFQEDHNCGVDGEVGKETLAALKGASKKPVSSDNTVTITGGSVNIRKGPNKIYDLYKTVHKGDKFSRVDSSDWVCVEYKDAAYWVSTNYVKNGVCIANSLNVRRGPGTDYTSIGTVKKGYEFKTIETNGWIPIEIGGAVYWVSANYAE